MKKKQVNVFAADSNILIGSFSSLAFKRWVKLQKGSDFFSFHGTINGYVVSGEASVNSVLALTNSQNGGQ